MSNYTKQETFDMVCEGLAAQGWKRSIELGTCVYHGSDGLKCAAGLLIPDEEYSSVMEELPVAEIFEDSPSLRKHDLDLLIDLQEAHDTWEKPEAMKRAFKVEAELLGLEWKFD